MMSFLGEFKLICIKLIVSCRDPQPDLTKSQILFDKQLPQQRKRRNYIDELEYGLTQHPLALYPHLEEGMSPEVKHIYFSASLKQR